MESNEEFGASRAAPRRKRVLVAEDSSAMRELLTLVLRERGFEVDCASSGSEMLSVLEEHSSSAVLAEHFDLIVTDVRMPGASGLDVVDRLRRDGESTPVIAVTAFPLDATVERSRRLGVLLLAKPFDLDALRSAVEIVMNPTPGWSEEGQP
ncbi:MAG: response regulator [Polyangiaceae bacterium]